MHPCPLVLDQIVKYLPPPPPIPQLINKLGPCITLHHSNPPFFHTFTFHTICTPFLPTPPPTPPMPPLPRIHTLSSSPLLSSHSLLLTLASPAGCSAPMDVSSICHNNSLLLFSAGPMAYGFWSDTALFSRDISWLGSRK